MHAASNMLCGRLRVGCDGSPQSRAATCRVCHTATDIYLQKCAIIGLLAAEFPLLSLDTQCKLPSRHRLVFCIRYAILIKLTAGQMLAAATNHHKINEGARACVVCQRRQSAYYVSKRFFALKCIKNGNHLSERRRGWIVLAKENIELIVCNPCKLSFHISAKSFANNSEFDVIEKRKEEKKINSPSNPPKLAIYYFVAQYFGIQMWIDPVWFCVCVQNKTVANRRFMTATWTNECYDIHL